MRVWAVCILVLLATACDREPSFNQRYSDTANTIAGEARNIDNAIDQTESVEAGEDRGGSTPPQDAKRN